MATEKKIFIFCCSHFYLITQQIPNQSSSELNITKCYHLHHIHNIKIIQIVKQSHSDNFIHPIIQSVSIHKT